MRVVSLSLADFREKNFDISSLTMTFVYIFITNLYKQRASLVAQRVKRLPAMRETWVWSLGWEYPLEKEMATHSSTLAWKIPWMEKSGRLQSMGSQKVRHDWRLDFISWRSFYFWFGHFWRECEKIPILKAEYFYSCLCTPATQSQSQ